MTEMTQETELERTERQRAQLERQLMEQANAEHHPRWTEGGELVLIGDVGMFSTGERGQVIKIDGDRAGVWVVPDDDRSQILVRSFGECQALAIRSRLPKVDDRPWVAPDL